MPTATMSAYPAPIEELMPAARDLAARLGEVPSRNRLMRELKVGAPKAMALRDALAAESAPAPSPVPVEPPPVPDPADVSPPPLAEPTPTGTAVGPEVPPLVTVDGHPDTNITTATLPDDSARPVAGRKPVAWPVLLLALPAMVAIWSGWVELGALAGFGPVHPLPGIWDDLELNTAVTLPIGMETYAAYALWVWLSGRAPSSARRFAKWSALGALTAGAAGQVAYHLMTAAGMTAAPWWITTAVACLPVAVLGMGAALAHLVHAES